MDLRCKAHHPMGRGRCWYAGWHRGPHQANDSTGEIWREEEETDEAENRSREMDESQEAPEPVVLVLQDQVEGAGPSLSLDDPLT